MDSVYQAVAGRIYLLWPLLMGLALAYLVSGAMHFAIELDEQSKPEVDSLESESNSQPSWAGIILRKNILNLELPEQDEASTSSQDQAELTDWRLLGTFTGHKDLALISISGQSKLFSPGQSSQGWKLTEVRPRTTLWQSGTQTQTLPMWTEQSRSRDKPSIKAENSEQQPTSTRVSLSKEDIQPILQDTSTLLQMARCVPYIQQGKTRGFRITEIQPNSLLTQLGVKNGDVLTRIDGQTITGPTDLLQAYASLEQSSLVSLDILRQDELKTFVVEIE
ncbi:MAG: PDZ domain-containing protein [Desulfovermiculus sp.]|nr:PDZ domain-containing protein [Desulfovermiculus sp.]